MPNRLIADVPGYGPGVLRARVTLPAKTQGNKTQASPMRASSPCVQADIGARNQLARHSVPWSQSCPVSSCAVPNSRYRPAAVGAKRSTRGRRLDAAVLGHAGGQPRAGRCRSGHRPRVERFAPTAAGRWREVSTGPVGTGRGTAHASGAGAPTASGRYREVGSGHAGSGRDCYQGSECRTVRWLRHRAVFMRPSPDGAGAIMSLCARRAGVL
ncbi:MAG: hypothetical protein ACJAQ3_003809, partial [Planctomycetota bacterium]